MRFHEIVNEINPIRKIKPGNYVPVGKKFIKDAKLIKLPGNNPFYYKIAASNFNEIGVFILDDDEVVGKLELENTPFPLTGAVSVDYITTSSAHAGRGIAKSLYGIVLSVMKRPLISGATQSPGGQRNWLSLANIPGVEINGYIKIPDSDFDTDKRYYDKTTKKKIEMVMAAGGEYLGTDKFGDHYFRFDVISGDNRMQSLVKEINLYSKDLYNTLEIGMYAQWRGK